MPLYTNFIDGEFLAGDHRVPNINPSDISDVIGEHVVATAETVAQAVTAARGAFGAWSASTPEHRFALLVFDR
mgnify:CR=1 FL=1